MKRALIVTLVVVAVIAAWWWHRRGRPPAAAGGPARPPQLPALRAEPASEPAGELPVLADDDPPGALRLEGLVLGPDDQPAGGVIVELAANPPRPARASCRTPRSAS